ncbi:MAG TPA: lipoprotein-releasing ABC transporter permease subunit [Rhizomicrobium sp.]|nr:lipoprotein-releasing ABC transporter permease subunit [Rhizomicrobium sp.]
MPESASRNTGAFAPFEWMIAARYLRAKRKESVISVISILSLLGIMIGVAALIIVMSVMNGFRVELLNSILGLSGHVTIQAQMGSLADYDQVAGRILKVPGVVKATSIVDGKAMATHSGYNEVAAVRGIRREDLTKITALNGKLLAGSVPNFQGDDAVIVGSGLANKLGLQAGGEITLIAPRGNITPFGTTPRVKTYHIISLFRVGNTLYDNYYVFMPLDEAQAYFNYGDTVSGIEVMLTSPDADTMMLPALMRAAGPMTRAIPWQDNNSAFFEVVEVERNVMFLILSLIVLVAALNIISGLIMLVKDKSQDIAILRTMGAPRGAIMRIFLIAGMSVGVAGTFLGFLVGVLFCANIESIRQALQRLTGTPLFDQTVYFLAKMPATLDPAEVIGVVVMALTLSFLATLYPSWRAARLDPVEALRYE